MTRLVECFLKRAAYVGISEVGIGKGAGQAKEGAEEAKEAQAYEESKPKLDRAV